MAHSARRRCGGVGAEKLTVAGQLNASLLMNRLIGSATAGWHQGGNRSH